jgi:hypothetical protein
MNLVGTAGAHNSQRREAEEDATLDPVAVPIYQWSAAHGFEVHPGPQGTLFDLLAERTDPATVQSFSGLPGPARTRFSCCAAIQAAFQAAFFSRIPRICAKGRESEI